MAIIKLPDRQFQALTAIAARQGLTLQAWLEKLADAVLTPKPLKTGRGMLVKYGAAPSAEAIDENRRDIFRRFAEGL